MDGEYFEKLRRAKQDNYDRIYHSPEVNCQYEKSLRPMFVQLYERLRRDIECGDKNSIIYKHHIEFIDKRRQFYSQAPYGEMTSPDDIVTDFIASMTDDYFIDICAYLLPDAPKVKYKGYFED